VPAGAEIIVTHAIQQAVAPVFLLTGVAAILGVLTNRLARIVDRVRALAVQESAALAAVEANGEQDHGAETLRRNEKAMLVRRRASVHWAIILCTLCALLICVVIATLFLGAELGGNISSLVVLLFVMAMLSLIGGLLCFLHEIALATKQFESRW